MARAVNFTHIREMYYIMDERMDGLVGATNRLKL